MKATRTLTRLLGLALMGVWGAVGYQVYTASFLSDSESRETALPQVLAREGPYIYKADVGDPFQIVVPRTATPKKGPEVIPWTPPPIRVTGILSGKGRMTAILEGATGDISFLGEGDTTRGVKILKIREGVVVYSYHKQKKEWTIDGRQ